MPSFNFQPRPQRPPPKRKSFDTDDGSEFGGLGLGTGEEEEDAEGDDYFGAEVPGEGGEVEGDDEMGGERKKGRSASMSSSQA